VNHAPIVPIVVPALAAALMLLGRNLPLQRSLGWLSTGLVAASALWMATLAADGWRAVYLAGNWAAPWGIVLVADRLSVLMVAITALLALVALAAAHGDWDARGEHFHPLFQIQLMGLNGAFLTGDVFNLFVFFEVLLIASYGLLVHGDGRDRIAAGVRFVTLNLVGSTLFLFAAGILYGVTGTLNMADLSVRVGALDDAQSTLVRIGAWLLLAVFCLKAAILPLCFWLPSTYAAAGAPVAALFAVMTKVGVYSIVRVYTMVFGTDAGPLADAAFPWIVVPAAAGYALAMLGALAGGDLRRVTAMLVVASAGFLVIGAALRTEAALAATIYYLPHTTFAAAALFLVADLVGRARGHWGDRLVPGATPARPAVLGLLFLASAAAVAGLPPLGGFIGKAMLLGALLPAGAPAALPGAGWLWAVLLAGGLAALIALARAGIVVFWQGDEVGTGAASARDLLPALLCLGLVAAVAVGAAPLQRYAQAAAADLLRPQPLVDQVLRTVPRPGPHQPEPKSYR
jgi:multicomponent K+:H+ antiporter subunit D